MAFDRKQWRSDRHKKLVTVTLQCEEKCRSLEAQLVTVTLQCEEKCRSLEAQLVTVSGINARLLELSRALMPDC
jgi:DNA-binding protein YbaB